MSTLRISTKDPNRALSLKDYLSQHGLHVVMLSPTELEIEDGNVSAELGNEISSWQHAHDLEIVVHPVTHSSTRSEESPGEEEWIDSEVPQREFVFAPQWRSAKIHAAKFSLALAAKGQAMRGAFRRTSSWLHETEEKILARSSASDMERKIAEEQAWAPGVQPIESLQPAKKVPLAEKIQLHQRIQAATASMAALRSTKWLTDGGKAVAFAGGIVMAGLIGIGLSVSHIDKASAGTAPPSSGSASTTVMNTSAEPTHPAVTPVAHPRQTARVAKPSPVNTPHTTNTHHALPAAGQYDEEVAENDSPEVVTHYYHQKPVSQLRKTTYNGVKHYSDMD